MRTSRKVDYDYAVDVCERHDVVTEAISDAFNRKWDLVSQPCPSSSGKFISTADRPTLGKAILKGSPANVEWQVNAVGPRRTLIFMKFALPPKLRLSIYLIVLLFYGAYFVVGRFIPSWRNVDTSQGTATPGSMVFLASVAAGSFTILLAWYLLNLLQVYVRASKNLVSDVASQLRCEYKAVQREPGQSQLRQWIDWRTPAIAIGLFLLVGTANKPTQGRGIWIPSTPQAWLLSICIVSALLLGLAILWAAMKGSYFARMALPVVAANLMLVSVVSIGLLGIPWAQEYAVQKGLIYLGHRDVLSQIEGPRLVNVDRADKYLPPSHALPDSTVRAVTRFAVLGMYVLPSFFCAAAFFMLFISARVWIEYGRERASDYQRTQADLYRQYGRAEPAAFGLRTSSWVVKYAVCGLFLVTALICWLGVLTSLSLIFALLRLESRLVLLSDGECLVTGATILARNLLNHSCSEEVAATCGSIMVAPTVLPLVIFLAAHVWFWCRSRSRLRSLALFDGDLEADIHRIGVELGVYGVSCFVDKRLAGLSPYADIRGVVPKKMIVMSRRAGTFLADNREYLEAVVAHEIGHLKYDCRKLRRLRIISRLGLTGVGFLGVTLDPIAMEDRADDFAKKYLRNKKLSEDLIAEAAAAIEAQNHLDEAWLGSNPARAAFLSRSDSGVTGEPLQTKSLVTRIRTAVAAAYSVYFEMELYHYLHREAKHRRA